MKLEIELIPSSTWGKNARSFLSKYQWDKIRKAAYARAGYKCKICKGGKKGSLDLHEVWEYDLKTKIQKLKKLIVLCKKCHECKHYGRTYSMYREEYAKKHLIKVNRLPKKKIEEYISEKFVEYNERNLYEWEVDMSVLNRFKVVKEKFKNDNNVRK